ncbi:hypothetical protein QTP88_010688 [Uroleucon formosanum]
MIGQIRSMLLTPPILNFGFKPGAIVSALSLPKLFAFCTGGARDMLAPPISNFGSKPGTIVMITASEAQHFIYKRLFLWGLRRFDTVHIQIYIILLAILFYDFAITSVTKSIYF